MHIHGTTMNNFSYDLYAKAGADKLAEAQRQADVRRQLLKARSEVDQQGFPEDIVMLGHWLDDQGGSGQGGQNSPRQY